MESNNDNTNASEKRIKSYEKKEQIRKAVPEIGIVIFGVLIMVGLVLWVVYFRFNNNISLDYFTFSRPLTYAILVGIILLVFVLMCCAKLLSIIAKNQVELMDSLSGTKEETSQISQSSVNVAANDDKVAKLKKLREADYENNSNSSGLLTQAEYAQKANEAYEKSNDTPSSDKPITSNNRADKVVRLMELREAELITQEEFEEQMAKI